MTLIDQPQLTAGDLLRRRYAVEETSPVLADALPGEPNAASLKGRERLRETFVRRGLSDALTR